MKEEEEEGTNITGKVEIRTRKKLLTLDEAYVSPLQYYMNEMKVVFILSTT